MRMRRGRTTQSRMELSRRRFWEWLPDGTAKEDCGGVIVCVLCVVCVCVCGDAVGVDV